MAILKKILQLLVVISLLQCMQPNLRAQGVKLTDVRLIPVFHKGRIKPFDSYANEVLEVICNTTRGSVELNMDDYFTTDQQASDQYRDITLLFPHSKQKWTAAEIVLSWLTEADKWEHVPFIYAAHEDVRRILGVEIENMKRKYVSPAEIKNSTALQKWLESSAQQQSAGKPVDEDQFKKIETVLGRLDLFRSVSLNASDPLTGNIRIADIGDRKPFCSTVQRIVRLLDTPGQQGALSARLSNLADVFRKAAADNNGALSSGQRLSNAIDNCLAYAYRMQLKTAVILGFEIPTDAASQAVVAPAEMTVANIGREVYLFQANIQAMQQNFGIVRNEFLRSPKGLTQQQLEEFQSMFREMQSQSLKLNVLCLELQSTLYANREGVLITPSANPYAVAKNRDEGMIIQPWISLQAVLHGQGVEAADEQGQVPGGILSGLLAQQEVLQVRRHWSDLTRVYTNRNNPDRLSAVRAAESALLNSLKKLGARATSARNAAVRSTLQPTNRDDDMLTYTAFPVNSAENKIAAEITYNDSKPFQYTFVFNLLALLGFALSFGNSLTKKLGLYFGLLLLVIGLGWTAYGFYLRIIISGWAPVTNMYETVVFVPFIVSLLALWFLMQPVIHKGLLDAWRVTAAPFLRNIRFLNEARNLSPEQLSRLKKSTWTVLGYVNTLFRLVIMTALFYFLTQTTYGDGGTSYFALVPDDWTSLNKIGVWMVGMICLIGCLWILPRFLLAICFSTWFSSMDFIHRRSNTAAAQTVFNEMHKRRFFGMGGTLMAGIGGLVLLLGNDMAADAQIINDNFSPLQPVLRSNFWLTIHVLTIVASYGAGALALGLGNIALGYYIFGKYRTDAANVPDAIRASESSDSAAGKPRPPQQCAALANYCYRSIQIAVLLLAIGTILGGLWADVSWGRFWGWDPKEVWALISLLIYLAFLHARYAGWLNNFGMIAGTVFGFTMIMMSWTGVNFGLPLLSDTGSVGLHSYGAGENAARAIGGVVLVVVLNWCFMFVAWVRYKAGIQGAVVPGSDDGPTEPEDRPSDDS